MNEDELIEQLLGQGLDALRTGDRATAQAILRRLLERDPRNVQAWYAMAWTLPTACAVAWCLEQVLTLDPDHAEAAAYLHQARTSPGRFTTRWLESNASPLDETPGSVPTMLSEAEHLAHEVDRRRDALERQVEAGDGLADGDRAAEVRALQRQPSPAERVPPRRQRAARVLICPGLLLLLLIAGALQVYPSIRPRLSSLRAVGPAFARYVLTHQNVANLGAVSRLSGDAARQSAAATHRPGVSPTPQPTAMNPPPATSTPTLPPTLTPTPTTTLTPSPTSTSTPLPTRTPTPTPVPLPPTRIVVPQAGIDAPVVSVSLHQARGEWEVPDWHAAGWHDTSAGLGIPGNTVLNGHNTTRGEVFRNLYRVTAGDVITLYAHDTPFSYTVSEALILPEAGQPREVRESNASYLLPTADERLTLVTCHPYGSLRNRLIVIAHPVPGPGHDAMSGLSLDSRDDSAGFGDTWTIR